MNNYTFVITMAGKSQRFLDEGYLEPKYTLKAFDKTLFEWAVESFKNFFNKSKFIFVTMKSHNSRGFIEQKCKKIGINNYEILELTENTDGQATTAYLALKDANFDTSLIIHNIDTHISPEYLTNFNYKGVDGMIPCFKMPGDQWSFVKVDNNFNAIKVAEKNRISDYCSIGTYYFSSVKVFIESYKKTYIDNKEVSKEKYIAPLYNSIISSKNKVKILVVPNEKIVVLGTPQEYENFISKH